MVEEEEEEEEEEGAAAPLWVASRPHHDAVKQAVATTAHGAADGQDGARVRRPRALTTIAATTCTTG